MESTNVTISEEWIRKKLNINHDNLEDIKTLSLAGTYQEKISHLGNSLHKFTRLKELDLSRNALVSLEGLENCKSLEKLNLYYNNIFGMKEMERLKNNPMLNELDLRLNPITKEENDYRLYLIQLLPSLKTCDDRAIRDGERQMAIAYFEGLNSNKNENKYENNNLNSNLNQHNNYEQFPSSGSGSASLSRVKSVANIAKRSAGISEYDDQFYMPRQSREESNKLNYNNQTRQNTENNDNYDSAQNYQSDLNNNGNNKESHFYRSKSMQNLNRAVDSPQNNGIPTNNGLGQRQKSVHFNDVATYKEVNGHDNLNLVDDLGLGCEEDAYGSFKPRGQFTPNPHYEQNDEHLRSSHDYDIVDNEKSSKHQQQPEEFKSTLFLLLDLVDRYWNGSKSLHQNFKFLGAANQLLKDYNKNPSNTNNPGSSSSSSNHHNNDEHSSNLMERLKSLQDENKGLKCQLNSHKYNTTDSSLSSELQCKNYAQEIDILKKKLSNSLEENKRLDKEFSEKSERIQKEHTIESYENYNGSMKKDNEIMKIKLKQYEQLQSLTAMLQESHKSLVTTNDHLLQEINNHKRELKAYGITSNSNNINNNRYQSNNLSDTDYSPTVSTHETNYGGQVSAKASLKKQYDQLNNSLTNRYGFQKS